MIAPELVSAEVALPAIVLTFVAILDALLVIAVACAWWERGGSDAKKPNTRKGYCSASASESTSSPLLFQYLEEITVPSL